MKDIRIERLAENLLNYSIKLKKDENILIEIIGEDCIPLAKELIIQAHKIGARPFFNIINYEVLRTMLKDLSKEEIKIYAKHDLERMKDMNAYIGIRAISNMSELSRYSKRKVRII